jgi:hypothetical protein
VNARNVRELAEALKRCRGHVPVTNGPDRIEAILRRLALDLASQAILAPSALTAEQLGTLSMRSPPPLNPYADDRKLLLQGLVRAAKGELI